MVKVENHWTESTTGTRSADRDRTAKVYLPLIEDPSQKELFFYVIDQFYDAMGSDRLNLKNEAFYTKFRFVLGGSLRLEWQTISAAQNNKDLDHFHQDVRALIDEHFASTARDDQLEYMRGAFKPFGMSVEALAARIKVISRLSRFLPGSWDGTNRLYLYETDSQYKRVLFTMVPMAWRIKFAETAHQLDDQNYKYSSLVQYLSLQEAIEKNARGKKRAHESSGSHGGRGRGSSRGCGRGGGRGSYGRGNFGQQDDALRDDKDLPQMDVWLRPAWSPSVQFSNKSSLFQTTLPPRPIYLC